MLDQSDKIAAMTMELIKNDPNREHPIDYRIAALKAAAAVLEVEMARQTMLAAMTNVLRR